MPFSDPSCSVDAGFVILKETAAIRVAKASVMAV